MRSLKENLLVRFSIVSLAIMALIAVGLSALLSEKIRSDTLHALTAEAVGAASGRVLGTIAPADLEVPMSGERYDRFHRFVKQSIVSERSARVKLWAKDGTIIYSDDPTGIGAKFPNNENFVKALRGETVAQIKMPEAPENVREQHLGTLMEIYTPLVFPGSAQPQGVLEIYQYYAPTAERIADLRRWIFGSVTAGFVLLYLGLVGLVRRGWGTINQQQAALVRVNQDLQSANEALSRTQDGTAKTLNETKLWAQKLRALAEMSRAVTATLDPRQVFNLIIKASSGLLDASAAAVWALEGERLILRASRGFQVDHRSCPPVHLGEGLTGCIARDKEPLIIPELLHDSRVKGECCVPEEVHAFAGVPLLAGDRCLGVLTVCRRIPKPFEADEVELLSTFAHQAAVAMENARLYEQLKEMAVIEERERIAREMHDGLAQQLGYLHLRIAQLEANPATAPIQEDIRTLKKVAAVAYDEVRQAILGLRTMVSRGLGLVPTLTEYLHDFSQQTGIAVELKIADERATMPSAYAEIQLIRIIQEALANVRKHAMAKRACVSFTMEEGNTKITIEDDGIGFDPEKATQSGRTGFGLQSMRERAELAGGTYAIESQPQAGTRVIVCLPVEKEDGM